MYVTRRDRAGGPRTWTENKTISLALMPPPAPLFVPPSELVQPWDTLEKTKLGLKFVFDPDRSRHLDPQSEIQRVTDRAIELWYLPLHSCVAECCAGTPPPLLVGVFRKLQHRCQAINRCAHSGPHSSGWVRKQVLLVLLAAYTFRFIKDFVGWSPAPTAWGLADSCARELWSICEADNMVGATDCEKAALYFMQWDPRIWHPLHGLEGYSFTPGEVPRKIPVGGAGLQIGPSAARFTPVPWQQTSAPPISVFSGPAPQYEGPHTHTNSKPPTQKRTYEEDPGLGHSRNDAGAGQASFNNKRPRTDG